VALHHDHYLLSDVLLADVFQNFRNSVYEQHHLDPLHFITLASLASASALKYTTTKFDLITDPDMYLMIEKNTRGGIATISHRYAQANNPLVERYDPSKPNSWITYLDANNLYGTAMSEPLPVGNFRFLPQDEISDFSVMSISAHGDMGYIIECDLKYHESSTNSTLTTPWHRNISPSRQTCLAISAAKLKPKIGNFLKSSSPTYWTKTKYVCHYRNLKFYIKHDQNSQLFRLIKNRS